jgi:phosphatidylglycerophosphatase C
MKIVIFDFCDTLVNFQTANEFVRFCHKDKRVLIDINNKSRLIYKIISLSFVQMIFDKFFPNLNISKKLFLRSLKGASYSVINDLGYEFYLKNIKSALNIEILNLLKFHQHNGDIIIVASGGYDSYLNFFIENFNIDYLLSTRIQFEKEILTGIFQGRDCLNFNKLGLVKKLIKKNGLCGKSKMVYTDSYSDLPLLLWVDEAVVVSKGQSQIWPSEYSFKEIII